ncbi:hypothetical protein F4804DRAFT_90810 [Jackrogersella minutella]|nr:hypothetical protein F4804DRAFT_90810 [Jackrogersella minutella]
MASEFVTVHPKQMRVFWKIPQRSQGPFPPISYRLPQRSAASRATLTTGPVIPKALVVECPYPSVPRNQWHQMTAIRCVLMNAATICLMYATTSCPRIQEERHAYIIISFIFMLTIFFPSLSSLIDGSISKSPLSERPSRSVLPLVLRNPPLTHKAPVGLFIVGFVIRDGS